MSIKINNGWQSILADLSLILFMITASVVQTAQADSSPNVVTGQATSPQLSTPIAIYRPGPGAPSIGDWLSDQSPDPRTILTITARYAGGSRARAAATALDLADQAAQRHIAARIVIEPAMTTAVVATLGYDRS